LKDKTPGFASKMEEIEMLNKNLQVDIEVLDNKITSIQDNELNAVQYNISSPDVEKTKLKQSKQSLTKT